MAGQIHRFKKERDFVNLDTHAIRNPKLSWKAKGLHSYLLQLPDNWQINIADLAIRSKDGRDGTSAGLTELVEAGYVVRQRVLNEKKQFEGWDYNVFEQPKQADDWKAENGKPVNGFAVNGKSDTNKYYTPTELSKNEEEEKAASLSSSTFGAEKEKRRDGDCPAPQTAAVRLYDPQLPGVTLVEPAPAPQYQPDPRSSAPAPIERVSIPDEIEALKTDAAAKETFTLSRKIPSNRFDEYVDAFKIDIAGRGETYPNVRKFRAHFFNWCGIRWEIDKKKPEPPKNPNAKPFQYRQL